jgi:hypothetical protein
LAEPRLTVVDLSTQKNLSISVCRVKLTVKRRPAGRDRNVPSRQLVMHAAAVGSGIGLVLRENELIVGT